MARIIELILTEDRVGQGTDSNPVRMVTELWTKDGHLVASCDNWNEESYFISKYL